MGKSCCATDCTNNRICVIYININQIHGHESVFTVHWFFKLLGIPVGMSAYTLNSSFCKELHLFPVIEFLHYLYDMSLDRRGCKLGRLGVIPVPCFDLSRVSLSSAVMLLKQPVLAILWAAVCVGTLLSQPVWHWEFALGFTVVASFCQRSACGTFLIQPLSAQ